MTITHTNHTSPVTTETTPEPQRGRRQARTTRSGLRLAVILVVSVVAFVYGASVLQLPDVRGRDASSTEFAAARAMDHVRTIGARPHPAGSTAMADVGRYISEQLASFGLELQPLAVRDPMTGVDLQVVAARLRGTAPTGAVLFIAHPDSVPMGPGAGDNATGAATLIETARALTAGTPLRNDVVFVFDDGEELGDYRGGELFAANHPWARDVRLAVGLDTAAWGIPFVMQDSDDNGVAIRGYAHAVNDPIAFGLDASTNRDDSAEIGAFRRRGVPGLEIEDTYANVRHHTADDRIDAVNPRSLQGMGDQVLALARSYGSLDLRHNTAADRTFFPLRGVGLVHYPAAWGAVFALLLVVGTAAAVVAATRRRMVTGRRALAGIAIAIAMLVTGMVMAKIGATVYEAWQPDPRAGTPSALGEYLLSSSAPFAIAMMTIIVIVLAAMYWLATRRLGPTAVGLGFLALWSALGVFAFVAAPVGAYLFQWPALAGAAVWMWLTRGINRDRIILLVPAVVAVVLLTPQLLVAYFGGGVANLPMLTLGTLLIGFIGPMCVSGVRRDHLDSVPGDPSMPVGDTF